MLAIKDKMIWLILIIFVITGCASIEKAESLHRQGDKEAALEMAISLLEDDSPKVRLRAVKLVGKIGALKLDLLYTQDWLNQMIGFSGRLYVT